MTTVACEFVSDAGIHSLKPGAPFLVMTATRPPLPPPFTVAAAAAWSAPQATTSGVVSQVERMKSVGLRWRAGAPGASTALSSSEKAASTAASYSLTSDIAALAPLVWLTYLSLGWTKMAGDVKGPLAPLVQLTYLRLNMNTNMTGDIKDLAPLVQLTTLDLSYTAVAGDVKDPPTPPVPPTGLFY